MSGSAAPARARTWRGASGAAAARNLALGTRVGRSATDAHALIVLRPAGIARTVRPKILLVDDNAEFARSSPA